MRHGVDNDRTKVSILIPCFNEEANVGSVYAAVTGVFRTLPDYDYEIIFTDNHSTDRTFALLRDMAARDPKVHVIRFSRNCGYQRRSEEHTSEPQSLMRNSYAVFCLNKTTNQT